MLQTRPTVFSAGQYRSIDVAVVDDDADFLEEFAERLTRHGLSVAADCAPDTALALISWHKPPLIFMDIVLPRFSGTRISEFALSLDYRTQIVLMTGVESEYDRACSLDLPIAGLLKKPFSWRLITPYLEMLGDASGVA